MAVTQKRPLDDNVFSTKHIVMDIEGTTTSISFVKDTLFPYVRQNLEVYLSSHWNEEEFKGVLNLLKDQAAEDKKAELEGAVEIPSDGSDDDVKAAVAKNVLWQMDSDRKTTALKKLQGHMWRQGYKSGELKGHLFADVAPALKEWVQDGRKLYVYSSGSVEAQKLLFGFSAAGDLTEFFTDFFDTEVGAKVDAESYKSIVKKLDCNADDVLFLTDLPKEASAAREAGLPVILVEREGNEPLANELKKEFSAVSSFQDLVFESTCKKSKITEEKCEDDKCIEEMPKAVNGDSVKESDPSPSIDEAMDIDKQVDEVTQSALESDSKEKVEDKDGAVKVDDKPEIEEKPLKEETMEIEAHNISDEAKVDDGKEANTPSTDAKAKDKKSEEETNKVDIALDVEPESVKKTDEVPQQKTDSDQNIKSDSNSDSLKDDETGSQNKTEAVVEVEVVPETPVSDVAEEQESVNEISKVEEKKEINDESKVADEAEKERSETLKSENTDDETKVLKSHETVEHKSEIEAEKEPVSMQAGDKEKSESEVTNGTEKVEEVKEKLNGSTNGTTNGTSNGASHEGKESEENGTVENGLQKVEDGGISEKIVAKSAAQIEGGNADSVAEV